MTGFGIGSVLTPLLAINLDTKVAAVSIPHVLATGLRFWLLRSHIDRRLLLDFGILSAVGGLSGALLHSVINNTALSVVFAGLLLFAGAAELTGLSRDLRFRGRMVWVAGFVSGLLGGLVGNQGGVRSATLLGFDLNRQAFVATATGIGLIVDAARMPVYLVTQFSELVVLWPAIHAAEHRDHFHAIFSQRPRLIEAKWSPRSRAFRPRSISGFVSIN